MADIKNDASTDIEDLARRLIDEMKRECAKLREARLLKNKLAQAGDRARALGGRVVVPPPDLPVISFRVGTGDGAARTPARQAVLLVQRSTDVCWSAHMADKARDIHMYANGRYVHQVSKAVGEDFNAFKTAWINTRAGLGLRDARGENGWVDGDPLHVEMGDSKLKLSDERSAACLEEYVRLTRKAGARKNDRFEARHAERLTAYIEKYRAREDGK